MHVVGSIATGVSFVKDVLAGLSWQSDGSKYFGLDVDNLLAVTDLHALGIFVIVDCTFGFRGAGAGGSSSVSIEENRELRDAWTLCSAEDGLIGKL